MSVSISIPQENHAPFDIHLYGSNILGVVESQQPPPTDPKQPSKSKKEAVVVPFRRVVEKQPAFQVCRMFLATLQLVGDIAWGL